MLSFHWGHMAWRCPNPDLEVLRSTREIDDFVDEACANLQSNPLWTRAFAQLQSIVIPAVGGEAESKRAMIDPTFTWGDGHVDGSRLEPANPRIPRCVWAAAIVDGDGNLRSFQYRPL